MCVVLWNEHVSDRVCDLQVVMGVLKSNMQA